MFIVINTPNGNVGRVVADQLIRAGEYVALLTRHPKQVADFARRGAAIYEGDLSDWNYVKEATVGCQRLFWATPQAYEHPDLVHFQVELGFNLARAVVENEIPYVVNVSSLGAQHETGTGAIQGLREVERQLDDSPANVLHLRAGYFMENFLYSMRAIQEENAINLPIHGAVKAPMVASHDIAVLATNLLCEPDWEGHEVREYVGPKFRSFDDAARVFSEVLGREIRHVHVSAEHSRNGMMRRGWSENSANLIIEMYQALAEGMLMPEGTPLVAPTTLRWFARTRIRQEKAAQG